MERCGRPDANAAVMEIIDAALGKNDLDLALAAYRKLRGCPIRDGIRASIPDAKAHDTPEAAAKRQFVERTWRPQFAETLRRLASRLARDPRGIGLGGDCPDLRERGDGGGRARSGLAYSKSIAATKTLPFETHQYFRPRGSAYIYRFAAM